MGLPKIPKNTGLIVGAIAAIAIIGFAMSQGQSSRTSYIGQDLESVSIP